MSLHSTYAKASTLAAGEGIKIYNLCIALLSISHGLRQSTHK